MGAPPIGVLTTDFVFSHKVRNTFGVDTDADSAPTYSIFENETPRKYCVFEL